MCMCVYTFVLVSVGVHVCVQGVRSGINIGAFLNHAPH